MKNITYATAHKKFSKDAYKLCPAHLTIDALRVYHKMAIEGLAYKAGYIIINNAN